LEPSFLSGVWTQLFVPFRAIGKHLGLSVASEIADAWRVMTSTPALFRDIGVFLLPEAVGTP
jgi:hypothetical protein